MIEDGVRKSLILVKASSHLVVHSKFSFFLKAAKKRKGLSPIQKRKWEREARRPLSYCTSFTLVGLLILVTNWNLSGLASIPLLVSMNPRNFPACTLKEHLVGFRRMSYFLTDCRISLRSLVCYTLLLFLISCPQHIPQGSSRFDGWTHRPWVTGRWRHHFLGRKAWHCSSNFPSSTWRRFGGNPVDPSWFGCILSRW